MIFFTNSGQRIDIENPVKEAIVTEDIAHALSLTCRASGQFVHFYSVAQHSLNCMKEALARGFSKRVCFACLIHDASEAYICDIPTPLKRALDDYREIEAKFEDEILKKFNLYPLSDEEKRMVKIVDEAMLWYEFKHLHTIPIMFEKTPHLCSSPCIDYMDMKAVERMFLSQVYAFENLSMTA